MNYFSEYSNSILLYCLLFFIALFFAFRAQKKNSKVYIVLIIVLLSVFLGLRGINTGTDTARYIALFEKIDIDYILNQKRDYLFYFLCYFFMVVFKSGQFVLMIMSVAFVILFITRIWELREFCSIPFCVGFFFVFNYLYAFNIMRETMAISIVFWASRFLFKGESIKFLIAVVICTFIHASSIVSALLFIIYDLIDCRFRINFKRIVLYLLIAIIGYWAIMMEGFNSMISHYTAQTNKQEGFSTYVTITFLIIITILAYLPVFKKNGFEKEQNKVYGSIAVSSTVIFLMSYFVSIVFSIFWEASRIAYYFVPFGMIFFSYRFDSKEIRFIKKIACIILVVHTLYLFFSKNGCGILPYEFYWQ